VTVETEGTVVGSGDHIVHFYEHDSELVRTVAGYLADGLRTGAVAIAIATEAHRREFEAELTAAGIDVAQASREGTLVSLDAAATMAGFMPAGEIDGDTFRRVIGNVLREGAQTGRPVRAFGEMVSLLWEAGDVLGAIELERSWNDLGCELDFSLLCAYRRASVSSVKHAQALRQVCHLHSRVSEPPNGCEEHVPMWPATGTQVSGQFPAELDAPAAARHFLAEALRRWGHRGSLLHDAELVVSELATNAVVHARSPFSVVARSDGSGVRVSVRDASQFELKLRDRGPTAISGRGLPLVAAVARDCGVEVTAHGKTVWAELQP
jgi:anti-sigma regulatory factor (Ser/Thr protein kinase)